MPWRLQFSVRFRSLFLLLDDMHTRFSDNLHYYGRIFTWLAIVVIVLVPVIFCSAAGVLPNWSLIPQCFTFMLGYMAIGLIEALSYGPLLGTGGQYLTFITGNISNLKLPCAINAQSIAKVKDGTEEKELVTTVAIAACSITTTLVILVGLIPLAIYQDALVDMLKPVSPYVVPAIFGGLAIVLVGRYLRMAAAPFIVCLSLCLLAHLLGFGAIASQGTMIMVGMLVGLTSLFSLKRQLKK